MSSKQLIPLAGAVVFLVSYCLMLGVFLFRLQNALKTLNCPALPGRCSDRIEYAQIVKDLKARQDISLTVCSRLFWPAVGRSILEYDLSGTVASPFFPRGIYLLEDHFLSIRDWCGFFEYRIAGNKNQKITVYPGSRHLDRGIPARRNHIPETRAYLSWLKTREYFDARPYHPGDDPRRINWRMLARHDELFIKEGNSLSPSRKSALLLLDGFGSVKDTDFLFREFSFLSGQLAEAGFFMTALLPGKKRVEALEKYTSQERENLFASVAPIALGDLQNMGGGHFGIIYFFAGRLPAHKNLRHLNEKYKKSAKILILSSSLKAESTELEGWKIVQP